MREDCKCDAWYSFIQLLRGTTIVVDTVQWEQTMTSLTRVFEVTKLFRERKKSFHGMHDMLRSTASST
jgi:hypothetical protein